MTYRSSRSSIASSLAAVLMVVVVAVVASAPLAQARDSRSSGNEEQSTLYRIGFHLWKPGKIYDEAMQGIRDGLALEGIRYEEVVLHSQRDEALAAQNLRRLDSMGLDVIYSLSSAGTKIAKRLGLQTPVIATVINHPASLGVGQEIVSTTKLTGTSYYIDAQRQLQLYRQLFPRINKVGMIYDSNNPAGFLAEEPFMRQACEGLGLQFRSVGIEEKSELARATNELINSGIELIVVPTNRLVYGNLQIVRDITRDQRIPVVSMNKQGVENGALAALFADTYNLGRQTAAMVRRIIFDDAGVSDIAFQYIPEPDVIVNLSSASRLDYEFPADVLSSAAIVIQ